MMRSNFIIVLVLFLFTACNQAQNTESSTARMENEQREQKYFPPEEGQVKKVEKTEEEWKKELSSEEFSVLRQAGTERAFSGEFWDNKQEGVYTCGACGLPLFSSDTKFKSGTGWPSFYEPIDPAYVTEKTDNSHGMSRTEVLCSRCSGHLGHVFPDGPQPTGLRYCMNSISLDFVPKEQLAEREP